MTPKEYIGFDSIHCVREVLSEYGSRRIFLVTGNESYSRCGAKAYMHELLKNYEVYRFCQFEVNPKIEDIERGIDTFRAAGYDTIIAIGGGSVIDMAKAINYLALHPLVLGEREIRAGPSEVTVRPLIAVPTTAGSGSEATSFAVVYAGRQKYSIDDERILPTIAIVDANLTMSMPKYTTAVSGMDAFGQAVESYWSVRSITQSKRFASDAIKLIITNLPRAIEDPTVDSRLRMAEAANLAGKAINITRTTVAHSISYSLTSYFGIAHGQAVALTLSQLLVFNANVTDEDVLDDRGAGYVGRTIDDICNLLGAHSVSDAKEKIDLMIRKAGLETRLSMLGVREKDVETIVANAFDPNRVRNNPRRLTRQALRRILHELC